MPPLSLSYPRPDIAVLTLDRPEKLNALSFELVEALHSTLEEILRNNECRVVVLTGAGRGFCSGWTFPTPTHRKPVADWNFRVRACAGRNVSPS